MTTYAYVRVPGTSYSVTHQGEETDGGGGAASGGGEEVSHHLAQLNPHVGEKSLRSVGGRRKGGGGGKGDTLAFLYRTRHLSRFKKFTKSSKSNGGVCFCCVFPPLASKHVGWRI